HCSSEPYVFFGREAELGLLRSALSSDAPSVVALVGPGGQGKTAILQHWLGALARRGREPPEVFRDDYAVFFWSFYRGKDSDLCLRELYAALSGASAGDVSASYCVDHILPLLRTQC